VKSPPTLNDHWQREGIDAIIIPMDIAPEHVASFFAIMRASANCAGISVTVPHKQAAFVLVDTLTPRARIMGAVNSIRRDSDGSLHGDSTDGLACVAALARIGVAIHGRRCVVVGAGGAGAAIAHGLAEAGASAISVHDLDASRAQALARSLTVEHPGVSIETGLGALSRAHIAVNGSTAGMKANDPLPFDPELLPVGASVVDFVTKTDVTPLLARARARGLETRTGAQVAAEQAHLQTDWFHMHRFRQPRGA
jgi:shikimate dehydrogenase